jgi:inositol 1,4,5-triphosphate receptor type 1/inositol 1,4,5-triphosphate receptor type 3
LFACTITNFDYSFKETGSIGAYLTDPNPGEGINYKRFAFDNIHKFFMMEIMIHIVAGIIIDTFGSLKK